MHCKQMDLVYLQWKNPTTGDESFKRYGETQLVLSLGYLSTEGVVVGKGKAIVVGWNIVVTKLHSADVDPFVF